jgi:hypothetical protein
VPIPLLQLAWNAKSRQLGRNLFKMTMNNISFSYCINTFSQTETAEV